MVPVAVVRAASGVACDLTEDRVEDVVVAGLIYVHGNYLIVFQ